MAGAFSETLRNLLDKYYTACCRCHTRDDDVRILPCLHVFCTKCLQSIIATPPQLTKYKRSRRFTCPSCQWPQYLHSDGIEGYPAAHPLLPTISSEKAECPFPDLSMETYHEVSGNLILDHCIGGHGVEDGCFTNITGMSVDESVASCPRVVVSDASQQKITVYEVDGKFCMTLKLEESIRDVCVDKNGDIFIIVVEKDYLIVHFDREGNRKENKLHTIGPQFTIIHQEPFGLCIDERGHFIASFLMTDSVCRFDEECSHVSAIGNTGKGIIKFNGPYYLARTSRDYTVVSDTCNHRVKIHNQNNGLPQLQLGSTNCEPGLSPGGFFLSQRTVCGQR
ncbi:hypothetical protein C0Q70_06352 [Pomacea canaliculata]|uniref:RING-type domain-containing protein n=1 Tax=Pomacea canaliculata TaxID=400727 RepID=A0A2T7PNR8_POMCA|nr:tripartite motif-containing protein 3-like [Pomacea canaliculata]PVD35071.1 hypothetical protein C0Q70_06352 [Pomacea canaliculata]